MVEFAINAYVELLELALPIAIVFCVGNLIVGTFLRTAFGGKLWLGK